ncbi:hypothetical protein J6590_083728 [Homalodisca vitripennis]|nr:hypothetical protein J6590_083728 [Homalodisca vitripennis]
MGEVKAELEISTYKSIVGGREEYAGQTMDLLLPKRFPKTSTGSNTMFAENYSRTLTSNSAKAHWALSEFSLSAAQDPTQFLPLSSTGSNTMFAENYSRTLTSNSAKAHWALSEFSLSAAQDPTQCSLRTTAAPLLQIVPKHTGHCLSSPSQQHRIQHSELDI